MADYDMTGVNITNLSTLNGSDVSGGVGGGAWEVISTTEVTTSVAQVDIEHAFDDTYKAYKIIISGVTVSDALKRLNQAVKSDGTYKIDSNYTYSNYSLYTGSNGVFSGATNRDNTHMAVWIDTNVELDIEKNRGVNPEWTYKWRSTSAGERNYWATHTTVATTDGFRFYPTSGTIDSGTFTLIGLK